MGVSEGSGENGGMVLRLCVVEAENKGKDRGGGPGTASRVQKVRCLYRPEMGRCRGIICYTHGLDDKSIGHLRRWEVMSMGIRQAFVWGGTIDGLSCRSKRA